MRQGLKPGQTAEIQFIVTPDMFAQFEGKVVHQLLSTAALGHQMEWAARQIILPYLEPHEEGMGARLTVHHHCPTPGGALVKVRASVSEVRTNKVECKVEAMTDGSNIADGSVLQAIVKREWIQERIQQHG